MDGVPAVPMNVTHRMPVSCMKVKTSPSTIAVKVVVYLGHKASQRRKCRRCHAISHASIEHCGRRELAEYCLHMHHLGDVQLLWSGQNDHESYFVGNSIQNGVNKGITLHGTHRASFSTMWSTTSRTQYLHRGWE